MTIDLQRQADVNMVLVGVPTYTHVKTLIVSVSTDGETFTEVGSHFFAKWMQAQQLFWFSPTPARYVRLTFPDCYIASPRITYPWQLTLIEVEVYANGEEPPPSTKEESRASGDDDEQVPDKETDTNPK